MQYVNESTGDIISKRQALDISGRINGPDVDPLSIPGIAALSNASGEGTATNKAQLVDGVWNRIYTPYNDEQRADMAKAEAARRINAVVDITAQLNLNAAINAGALSAEDLATFALGVQWIGQMRAAWPVLAADNADISDDANWPLIPVGVIELADRF